MTAALNGANSEVQWNEHSFIFGWLHRPWHATTLPAITLYTRSLFVCMCVCVFVCVSLQHTLRVLVWRPWVLKSTGAPLVGERKGANKPWTDKKLLQRQEQVVPNVSPAARARQQIITATSFTADHRQWTLHRHPSYAYHCCERFCFPPGSIRGSHRCVAMAWHQEGVLSEHRQQLLCAFPKHLQGPCGGINVQEEVAFPGDTHLEICRVSPLCPFYSFLETELLESKSTPFLRICI